MMNLKFEDAVGADLLRAMVAVATVVGFALGTGACGETRDAAQGAAGRDDSAHQGGRANAGGEGGAASAAPGPIAVLTRICSPEGCQHLLNAFAELPADGKIDRTQGVESGNTQGVVFDDAAFIFDRDDKSVTRWTVTPDAELVRGETVSFLNAGVVDACAICNVFGDATHAYMVDPAGGVIVTWNPTSMELVTVQELPAELLTREGLPAGFAWPQVVAGRAFLAAAWMDYETLEVYGRAAVLTFDATVDEPEVQVIEDDRCGVSSAVTPFADAAGNVYVVGDWSSGLAQIGSLTPAPNPACLLRINAEEDRFDPDYYVDLLDVAGARAVYGAYGMAGGAKMLLNYWPRSEAAPSAADIEADAYAYYRFNVFRYSVLDLETLTTTEVTDIPPAGAGNNTPLRLDGSSFIHVYPQGNDSSAAGADLFAISADGSATKVLEAGASGDFEMVGRLRAF